MRAKKPREPETAFGPFGLSLLVESPPVWAFKKANRQLRACLDLHA
jgi:hypothetical protein